MLNVLQKKTRHTSRSASATMASAISDDQPRPPCFPEQDVPAVFTMCKTVEKSRRSDASEGTAMGGEGGIDPNRHTQFELEEGSVVYVTFDPKPLGLRAAEEEYTPLVDPLCASLWRYGD